MTALPENDIDEEENFDSAFTILKRKLYSKGGSIGQKANLTIVNRLKMLCVAPGMPETYHTIEVFFRLTKINNIPFKFVSDFSVILM